MRELKKKTQGFIQDFTFGGGGGGGGTVTHACFEAQITRGVWGHGPQKMFEFYFPWRFILMPFWNQIYGP